MPFQSDFKDKRTWDPDSGWELFEVRRGPGHPKYELRCDGCQTLHFWCADVALDRVDGVNHLGHPNFSKTMHVHFMNAPTASQKEKQLIHDALSAFGSRHNGPSGPLKLIWDDAKPPTSHLTIAILCANHELVRKVAGKIIGGNAVTGSDATEFLWQLVIRDASRGDLQVSLERDRIAPSQVTQFLDDLNPFWLALFSAAGVNAKRESDARIVQHAGSRVGRAGQAFRALAADKVLVALEDDRLDKRFSWHVDQEPNGRVTFEAFEY